MKKCKTCDAYHVYQIKKEKKKYYLANTQNYQKNIDDLLETIDGLKYDSIIFIFGIDTGEYLQSLSKLLCSKNRVIIFEPNKRIYNKQKSKIPDNIQLFFYEKMQVKRIFADIITSKNFNNLYMHAFGSYSEVYKQEYDEFIHELDWAYINASSQIYLANRFKEVFIQNMLANLKILNKCTPIHHYRHINHNIPAIVVSGGPSLDQNMKDMLENKDKLKNCFIITGSRTVGALMQNGIKPDMIVSVDPIDANYDMMKDYLDLDVPLAFYEYSNRYLVRDYKGEKIYISLLFSRTIEELQNLKGVYSGGSVAHACVDLANMLGCSPILLTGQDLAYTYDKHHSDVATFEYDKTLTYKPQILTKDILGNEVKTTITLDNFKRRLEEYIERTQLITNVEFINCSYGADIKGAPHQELSEVFNQELFSNPKKCCAPHQDIRIDGTEIVEEILSYMDECMVKASRGLELCEKMILDNMPKSLVEVEEEDIDLQRMLYIIQLINEFENSPNSKYLGGYFSKFIYDIKQKAFLMLAKDYDKLTSDLQYQARAFKTYFEDMQQMLEEAKSIALQTVTEFYK